MYGVKNNDQSQRAWSLGHQSLWLAQLCCDIPRFRHHIVVAEDAKTELDDLTPLLGDR